MAKIRVIPKVGEPFEVEGKLSERYFPDCGKMYYIGGVSYPAEIVDVIEQDNQKSAPITAATVTSAEAHGSVGISPILYTPAREKSIEQMKKNTKREGKRKMFKLIIQKSRVYFPPKPKSYSEMLEELGITDNSREPDFMRAEITPANGDVFAPLREWRYRAEQDYLPEWYAEEADKERAYKALEEWAAEHIITGRNDFEITGGAGMYYIKDCANVKISGRASVTAWGNTSVKAHGNASVIAYGNASVEAGANASVTAYNEASVTACGNATITTPEYSTAKLEQLSITENALIIDYRTKTIRHNNSGWTVQSTEE